MFDLEHAIADWRQRMIAGGIKSSATLDELENHLREDFLALKSGKSISELEAFQIATWRIGKAGTLRTEFAKVDQESAPQIGVRLFLIICGLIAVAALSSRSLYGGQAGFLLPTHIFSLTVGYLIAFLTGGLGIYYVCCRRFGTLSLARERSLSRTTSLLSRMAAAFVAAGFLLGMIWSVESQGQYLGGPRGIGALCACVWLIAISVNQARGRIDCRINMLLNIAGNMVVGLAWFGAGMMAAHGGPHWLLGVLLGAHLTFLLLGALPASETAKAQ